MRKSLYGLKQAPKQWYDKCDQVILSDGFSSVSVDKCVYTKTSDNEYVIISLYVDDMLIFSSSMNIVHSTKHFLASKFDMKDMGVADVILGMKITKISNGYALSQSHYIEKVLKKFSHLNIKEENTSIDPSVKLVSNDGRSVAQLEYAKVIGSLMYATQFTRSDIAFAVSKLSQFTSNPSVERWKAIGRVLGYLKKTKELILQYSKFHVVLKGYTNAS